MSSTSLQLDLSDPQAVWAAAYPILTQPNAADIFAHALRLLPDLHANSQQRIQLELCRGLALFASSQIGPSLAVLRAALQMAACQPMSLTPAQPVAAFDTQAGLSLLREALVGLAARHITAFATGGVLLGLVRDGRLLPHDKDLDVVVPIQQLQQAADALPALGWKPAWTAVKAVNFRSFVHSQHAITLDLFALVLSDYSWGSHWEILDPEPVLEQLYGLDWRTPDTEFDSTLESPALQVYNDYTRTWAALRLLEAWVQGQSTRVARLLRTLARLDPSDPVVHAFSAPHAHPLPC